ncbi:unnamed protein product [Brugia timori]|uniref:Uncharacterized protein n=1 Tax=Brugia timori TaxID=42155 RepID=A0A0R3QAS2_9BILA|nr:unnamed protein product [Brugia timori]
MPYSRSGGTMLAIILVLVIGVPILIILTSLFIIVVIYCCCQKSVIKIIQNDGLLVVPLISDRHRGHVYMTKFLISSYR